jgi:predicted glutamine amidotransferase
VHASIAFLAALAVLPTDPSDNCWIWAGSSGDPAVALPADELRWQLIDGDSPTVNEQACSDDDGWSLSWWTEGATEPEVVRDPDGAEEDEDFPHGVDELAAAGPHIAMAHFRSTTSGCEPETGNPHPFVREFEGGTLSLQHNGTVSRSWLEELIGSDYLEQYPPLTCPDDPVDSELILMFVQSQLAQRCEGVSVHDALHDTLAHLATGYSGGQANLIISDASTLWAARLSSSNVPSSYPLHYRADDGNLWVARSPVNGDEWTPLDNLTLLAFPEGAEEPSLTKISRRLDLTIDLDGDDRWCDGGGDVDPGDAVPVRLLHLDPRGGGESDRRVRLDLPPESPVLGVVPPPSAFSTDDGLSWWPVSAAGLPEALVISDLQWDLEGTSERLDVTVVVEAGCTQAYLPFRATWSAGGIGEAVASQHAVCSEVVEAPPLRNANPPSGCSQAAGAPGRALAAALALGTAAATLCRRRSRDRRLV